MEILTGDASDKVDDEADKVREDLPKHDSKSKSKPSRRRVPKNSKSTNGESENSGNTSGNENRLLQMKKDTEFLSNHIESLKARKSDKRITWEQISELSEKLSNDETIDEFSKDEHVPVP